VKKAIQTEQAPAAIGPYSQAITSEKLLFISGQLPVHPSSGSIEATDADQQAEQVLLNLKAVLSAAGLSFDHVVKTTIFLTDLTDFQAVNEVYKQHASTPFPARSTIQVAALPMGAKVEIEAIAQLA
jgi:2-iminobutanoate/2-iminopropanoate deaminase